MRHHRDRQFRRPRRRLVIDVPIAHHTHWHHPPPHPPQPIPIQFFALSITDFDITFPVCIGITLLCLFSLGALQAWITRQSMLWHGGLMTLNGGLAAGASYLVSWGLLTAVGGVPEACDGR